MPTVRILFLWVLLMLPQLRHKRCWGGYTPEPHDVVTGDYWDSTIAESISGAIDRHNSFARIRFTTDGNDIDITYWANFASNAWLAILVNGVFDQLVTLTADGAPHTTSITLGGSGLRTIEVWEGPQYDVEPNIQSGGIITSFLVTDAPMTMLSPTPPSRRVVVYGDSISQGYPLSPEQSYIGLIRRDTAEFVGGITSLGSGGRSLKTDEAAPGLPAIAAHLSDALADSAGLKDLVITIGTNDWGQDATLSAFQTNLETLIDAVHALRPATRVRVFSPLDRAGETTPNGNGDVLDDFRNVMQVVAAARPSFCTYHDGKPIVDIGTDGYDGTHLNATGNEKMRDAVLAAIDASIAGEFRPSTVGTVRVDHDARFVTTSGGDVTAIIDQSGNAYHAAPPTIGQRPTLSATVAAYNNKPAIRFTGSQFLETPTGAGTFAASGGHSPFTVAIVGHFDGDETAVNGFTFSIDRSAAGVVLRSSAPSSPKWQVLCHAATVLDTSTLAADAAGITVLVADPGGTWRIYRNSKTSHPLTMANQDLSNTGITLGLGNLGSSAGSNYVHDGPLCRVIVWDDALSNGNVGAALDGLGALYGIAIAP